MRGGGRLADVKPLFPLLTLAALASGAGAQTAQDILNRVDTAQKAAKDVTFRLSGSATLESSPQKIDLTVYSRDECNELFGEGKHVTRNMFCAGAADHSKGTTLTLTRTHKRMPRTVMANDDLSLGPTTTRMSRPLTLMAHLPTPPRHANPSNTGRRKASSLER